MAIIEHAGMFIISVIHAFVILATVGRIIDRRLHVWVWWDDLLAIVVVLLGMPLIVRSTMFAIHRSPAVPLQYRLEWGLTFLIIWCSQASLVMSATRVQKDDRYRVIGAWIMVGVLMLFGILFGLLVGIFCLVKTSYPISNTVCLCVPNRFVLIGALLAEFLVNILSWHRNWTLMVQETGSRFATLSLRLRFAMLGLNGNMIILLFDLIWLCVYLTGVASQDPMLAAYFTSGVAVVSIFALNISPVIGIVSRLARGNISARDPPAGAQWGRLASVLSDL